MLTQDSPQYLFIVQGLPAETFHLVRFTGDEAVSSLYRLDILLASRRPDIDLATLLDAPATLGLVRDLDALSFKDALSEDLPPGLDILFQGVASRCEQLHQAGDFFFYRFELAPRLWRLNLTTHSQVFLNKSVPQFLAEILTAGGLLAGQDFEFRLHEKYPAWEYVCQYNESHFDFFNRWLEREGMYYYFEQTAQGEKLIITDSSDAHRSLPGADELLYSPAGRLDANARRQTVHAFRLQLAPAPRRVRVKDYNYRTPSLDIAAAAEVSGHGHGEVYVYGERPRTPTEAARLVKVRAQALRCNERVAHGESYAPALRAGFLFTLSKHYRAVANQEHLALAVRHEGGQQAYLQRAIGLASDEEEEDFYHNSFTAMPAAEQFRPQQSTAKPRCQGVFTAFIDGQGSGEFAELDEQGRYKVLLPFDLAGRPGGNSSAWLRRAQPYAGTGHGLHFPLRKGVEVLLSCLDGDPDRPVIVGAAPNPLNPSPVSDATQTMCQLTTAGQNKLHIEDKQGSQRILMQTPTGNTWLRLGAPNDPPTDPPETTGWQEDTEGAKLYTEKSHYGLINTDAKIYVGSNYTSLALGSSEVVVLGMENISVVGLKTTASFGLSLKLITSFSRELNPLHCNTCDHKVEVAVEEFKKLEARLKATKKQYGVCMNELTVAKQRIKAADKNAKFATDKLAAANTTIDAVNDSIDVATEKIQIAAETLEAANRVVVATESKTTAFTQSILAAEDDIGVCDKKLKTSGQRIAVGSGDIHAVGNAQII